MSSAGILTLLIMFLLRQIPRIFAIFSVSLNSSRLKETVTPVVINLSRFLTDFPEEEGTEMIWMSDDSRSLSREQRNLLWRERRILCVKTR